MFAILPSMRVCPYLGEQMAEQPSFKDTLNLPRTDFPIRPNAKAEQETLLARWQEEDLYAAATACNEGKEKFILHDGPPYANGHIHIGHAYNKVLKDIITKSRRMAGMHVPVIPGWDCHGLPIELKVTKENPGMTGDALITACRAYAESWINVQRQEFKRLGVVMDWDKPYSTMSYSYEAATLRALGEFAAQGYIQKKLKTVPWCASCQTVLSQAEIEYQERKDPSIFVLFNVDTASQRRITNLVDKPLSLVIWTTTPWTLPLNRAVLVHPEAEYVVVATLERYLVMGASRLDALRTLIGFEGEVVARLTTAQLQGAQVHHPVAEGVVVPVIASDIVSLEDGTAFVHCAPGCGPEDYEVALQNQLEVFCPVSPAGVYQQGIMPTHLMGMTVAEGQSWVLTHLTQTGKLLFKTSLRHPYPHCWRCRNGLIYRATSQWFCDLSKHHLKEKAVEALQKTYFVPSAAGKSFSATVAGRLEWCLSRQRTWGVPIPAVVCTACGHAELMPEVVKNVVAGIAKEGLEYWRRVSVADIMPHNTRCTSCQGTEWAKEYDILDVWFESGISHYVVLQDKGQRYPADVYCEGRDQTRGWFQSSLLTSLVLEQEICTKAFVTHGYTVDAKGHKMSKSLGNGVEPQEMIDRVGVEGLRLWAASIETGGDAVVSDALLTNIGESYRKIRNTARFLLSNLYDFDITTDAVAVEKLPLLDQYALVRLMAFEKTCRAAYEAYDATGVYHALIDYCTTELSAFYLDIIKDRLYVEKADGFRRRAAQTVCYHILHVVTTLMAPLLSFTAEQISDLYQPDKDRSIHLQPFGSVVSFAPDLTAVDLAQWRALLSLRDAALKAIEIQRVAGVVKHPLEAQLIIGLASDKNTQLIKDVLHRVKQSGQSVQEFLAEFCIVSQCHITDFVLDDASAMQGVSVRAERATGAKCPRCWQYTPHADARSLCQRCSEIC